MKTIDREELKAKLDRGDNFKLVMTLSEYDFKTAHIPGSLNISHINQAEGLISPDDEIVVYCSNPPCQSSQKAYHILENKGYKNVRRYAGGIEDWVASGYPIESELDKG